MTIAFIITGDIMKNYSIEELDAMTELVTKICVNLIDEGCSFDEACEIARAIPIQFG